MQLDWNFSWKILLPACDLPFISTINAHQHWKITRAHTVPAFSEARVVFSPAPMHLISVVHSLRSKCSIEICAGDKLTCLFLWHHTIIRVCAFSVRFLHFSLRAVSSGCFYDGLSHWHRFSLATDSIPMNFAWNKIWFSSLQWTHEAEAANAFMHKWNDRVNNCQHSW